LPPPPPTGQQVEKRNRGEATDRHSKLSLPSGHHTRHDPLHAHQSNASSPRRGRRSIPPTRLSILPRLLPAGSSRAYQSRDLASSASRRGRWVRVAAAAAMFWKDSSARSSSSGGREQSGVGPFGQVRVLVVGDSGPSPAPHACDTGTRRTSFVRLRTQNRHMCYR
jgi:hypothetical protein